MPILVLFTSAHGKFLNLFQNPLFHRKKFFSSKNYLAPSCPAGRYSSQLIFNSLLTKPASQGTSEQPRNKNHHYPCFLIRPLPLARFVHTSIIHFHFRQPKLSYPDTLFGYRQTGLGSTEIREITSKRQTAQYEVKQDDLAPNGALPSTWAGGIVQHNNKDGHLQCNSEGTLAQE